MIFAFTLNEDIFLGIALALAWALIWFKYYRKPPASFEEEIPEDPYAGMKPEPM